jgi:putative CocE/NonD family hydrolase
MKLRASLALAALFLSACAAPPPASEAPGRISKPNQYSGYSDRIYDGVERTSFYVPVRDGTRLAVDLLRPTRGGVAASEKLPVVWMHTPYNRRTYNGQPAAEAYPGFAARLVAYGYNVAVVDFRGVYASHGRNVAYNRGEWIPAARMDAYDVTEWFAAQPWSNGRIGMWGCSATGGSQMQALTTRPPHLRAVIPMSAEFDVYPFTTLGGVAGPGRIAPPGQSGGQDAVAARDRLAAAVDGPDGAAQLAAAVASHSGNIESVGTLPFRDSRSEATDGAWWMQSSPAAQLDAMRRADVGVLSVANWDEAGTKHGPFFTFNNLDPRNTKLLVGPGRHCAWSGVKTETGFDLVTEELRFFDYWLKGVRNGVMDEPAVTYYTYNAPAGSEWRQSETWPPRRLRQTDFFLSPSGGLASSASAAGRDAAEFGAAPSAPTILFEPAAGGLNYSTEPLAADIEVTGHPVMTLWIETAAGDADVTARLDDVAPDGSARSYQMVGRLRASHRTLATPPYNYLGLPWMTHREADARPLPANQPEELKIEMLPMSYIFKAGHRIRLNLSFADPQRRTGAVPSVSVLRGPVQPSRITLPVAPAQ